MNVVEYKAERSAGFAKYWAVFIPTGSDESILPAKLKAELGNLYFEMESHLESDDYYSPEEKDEIIEAITADGYYLKLMELHMGNLQPLDDDEDVDGEVELEI